MNVVRRLLVLAPHTDDAELGCGGTMVRLLAEGAEVYVVAFSTAQESLPEELPPDTLKNEFLSAMELLGIRRNQLKVFNYPVRRLTDYRQDLLENLVTLNTSVNPDMVLVPSGADVHQDHQVLYAEAVRAFKRNTIWGYELPWNHITFTAQAFVTLQEFHVRKKWEALQAYKSQLALQRCYFKREFVEGLARVRGAQVGVDYAEAFEVVRVRW